MHASIAELAINRLSVIPFTIHPALQTPSATKLRAAPVIASSASYSDIDNYNTIAHASAFLTTPVAERRVNSDLGAKIEALRFSLITKPRFFKVQSFRCGSGGVYYWYLGV